MRRKLRQLIQLVSSPWFFALFLLAICVAAYAPLITRLGFYWDDFPISWIAATMGGEGLERYFSTNRPVWGIVYRATTPLLGSTPLTWQIFGLVMRWVSGLALWVLLRLVWRSQPRFAGWAAALFVLYPGFSQQFIAFMYSHFYIVLNSLLISLLLMILALRKPGWFWPLTAASGLFSLLNLLAMEYFFLLDLLRPVLIWTVLSQSIPDRRRRFYRTLQVWLPYLIILGGAMFWRSVLFGFQTYQPTLIGQLKTQPLQALPVLIATVFRDVWLTSAGAWARAFTTPTIAEIGAANVQRYWLFVVAGGLMSVLFLLCHRPVSAPTKRGWIPQNWALQPLAIGVLALLLAGGPFWLTGLRVGLVFPNDRFTLPFMLGASLMAASLITWLPLIDWIKPVLLGAAIGFAIGLHFQYAIVYNRDWSVQRSMFWQMTWRIPDLQPGTVLLANELPVTHYTDNSLSAPLNWIYDPANDPQVMKYVLFYPTLRKAENLGYYQKDRPVFLNYLATTFHGSTSQVITLYYQPPGCLRVLDPQVDAVNWMVPNYLRETLSLSTTTPILASAAPGKPQPHLPAHIFGSEIAHGWCYYYEKADLARQFEDWVTVVSLGDEAFANSDYPNDPVERFPFIEGYAHTGRWDRALELSREAHAVSPVMQPVLCRLWQRIEQESTTGSGKQETLEAVWAMLECGKNSTEVKE